VRVLLLNHNLAFGGGTFNRAYAIGRELAARGHRVTLISIHERARWRFEVTRHDGLTLVRSPDLMIGPARTGWDPYDTLRRVGWLRGHRWDLIHAFDCRPAVILPALAARRFSPEAALVIDWADWWGRGGTIRERSGWFVRTVFGPIETFFEEAFRRCADRTTVISTALRDRAVALGVPPTTVTILPHGCDCQRITPEDPAAARARLGIPASSPLVGWVGALARRDASLLWEVLRLLVRTEPALRLVLIGRPRVPVPSDVGPWVKAVGFVSEPHLRDWVAACDVMLTTLAASLASRARWPSKVNDYLAAGKAVVITNVGDFPRLLSEHQAAVVCPPKAEALAAATLHVLREPALRHQLEQRARWVAEQVLAWPTLIDRLQAVYAAAVAERQRHRAPAMPARE
jgi:glycosyltransferase involved in cell wall biosynthesis